MLRSLLTTEASVLFPSAPQSQIGAVLRKQIPLARKCSLRFHLISQRRTITASQKARSVTEVAGYKPLLPTKSLSIQQKKARTQKELLEILEQDRIEILSTSDLFILLKYLVATQPSPEALQLKSRKLLDAIRLRNADTDFRTLEHLSILLECYTRLGYFREPTKIAEKLKAINLPANPAFFSTLLLVLGRRDFGQAFSVFKTLLNEKEHLDLDSFITMTKHCGMYQKLDRLEEVEGIIREMKFQPRLKIYSALIFAYSKNNQIEKCFSLLEEMKSFKLQPSNRIYTTLIRGCRATSMLDKVDLLYSDITQAQSRSDIGVYNSLISFYAHSNVSRAVQVFRELPDRGLVPDLFTYSSMIHGFCKHKQLDQALTLYYEMLHKDIQPNVVICNTLIDAHAKLGLVQKGLRFYQEMAVRRIPPDVHTYNILINMYAQHSDLARMQDMFQEMLSQHCRPDTITYSTLISGYSKNGQMKLAESAYSEMLQKRLVPNLITYNTMLHGYGLEGDTAKMESLFEGMLANKVSPNRMTFDILLNAHARHSRVDEVAATLERMKTWGVSVDSAAYDSLVGDSEKAQAASKVKLYDSVENCNRRIREFIARGDMDAAKNLYDEMKQKKIFPDTVTCNTLIFGWLSGGCFSEAVAFLEKMKEDRILPDKITYNSFVTAYARASDPKSALLFFNKMRGLGIVPDIKTFSSLIHAYVKCADMDRAQILFSQLLRSRIKPDMMIFNILINGYAKRHQMQKALDTLSQAIRMGCSPNCETYNGLIDGYCKSGNFTQALAMYREMKAKRIPENSHTFSIIMNCFSRLGENEEVLRIWEVTKRQGFANHELNPAITVLLDSCGFNSDLRTLQSVWSAAKQEVPLDENNFNSYIEALCRLGAYEHAKKVFIEEMPGAGIRPSLKTCQTLLTQLRSKRRVDDASVITRHIRARYPSLYDGLGTLPKNDSSISIPKHPYTPQN
ncbi:TPR-like protein [Basidiobolus meristosporus CBS 931.73]|uniref:TPR-like protein n=1 Tax=Basidiobolus meristosporus CBS 931.73 TaxID=1314790 RepID=A0A1Y1XNN1_9FUNG|nr:TPR-like protein [Basidiobolus meristosporus CBS 931.73]|eukprot:ORX87358.1 TPR-like protein [Basidiobolus meristosporus CBS 931.73]